MATRRRSPRHPSLSLPEAIDKVRLIWDAESRNSATEEVLANDLGYSGLNGRSKRVLATLKQYGLIEPSGDGHQVSDDAVSVLMLRADDPARREAVARLAFAPDVFAQMRAEYRNSLPSNDNLRYRLVKQGFSPDTAGDVVAIYRQTVEYVDEAVGSQSVDAEESGTSDKGRQTKPAGEGSASGATSVGAGERSPSTDDAGNVQDQPEVTVVRLSPECRVRIAFEGVVTQEAVERLIAFLEWGKGGYPTQSQLAGEPTVRDDLAGAL